MILFGGNPHYPVRDGVYMLREILAGALPAHPTWITVSVKKCHGTLGECELWEVTGLV